MTEQTELQQLQERCKRAWLQLHNTEMSDRTARIRLQNEDACLGFLRYYSRIHGIKC